jgi:hypothetical protein
LATILKLGANGVRNPRLTKVLERELMSARVDTMVGVIDLVIADEPSAISSILELLKSAHLDNERKEEFIVAVQSSGERNAGCALRLDEFSPNTHVGSRKDRLDAWSTFYSRTGACLVQSMRRRCLEAFDVSDETNLSIAHLTQTILNDYCGYGQVKAAPFFGTALKSFFPLVIKGADELRMLDIAKQLIRYQFLLDAVAWNGLVEASLREWKPSATCSRGQIQAIVKAWSELQIQDAPHVNIDTLVEQCDK